MPTDAHAKHGKKPSHGRRGATEKKFAKQRGSKRRGSNARMSEIMRLIQAGKLHLSAKEMKRLRNLNVELKRLKKNKVLNLHKPSLRNRQVQRSGKTDRFVVDSGATITLLRSKKWLRTLLTRLRAIVKTATGESVRTEAHGPLQVWSRNRKGENVRLGSVGEGHLLRDLAFPLLSVSQMCKHGCTVVFKPKDAFMITAEGEIIPFEQEGGLYFLPTGAGVPDVNAHTLMARDEFIESQVKSDPRIKSKSRKIMRMLKRAGYHHQVAGALRLDGPSLVYSVDAQTKRAKLDRLKAKLSHAQDTALAMTRAQRASKPGKTDGGRNSCYEGCDDGPTQVCPDSQGSHQSTPKPSKTQGSAPSRIDTAPATSNSGARIEQDLAYDSRLQQPGGFVLH